MLFALPKILALDFDGVLLDGLVEYFLTTQRAYGELWLADHIEDLASFQEAFYRLRPVIETGWEMPVLLRALFKGYREEEIEQNWAVIAQSIVEAEQLEPKQIAEQLDRVRDGWICSDLEEWLGLHRFYPGVIARVQQIRASATVLYIVTTKEGRFVRQLLSQAGVELDASQIIGKESQQPKFETLRQLLKRHGQPVERLWFVEDRLKTLQKVSAQNDLSRMGLFLADWGYNTVQARTIAQKSSHLCLLSVRQFCQDFPYWQ